MKKKALIVATVGRFFKFEENDMKLLSNLGYEIHLASNFESSNQDDYNNKSIPVIKHQIGFARNPFSKPTLKAFSEMKKLLSNDNYQMIHCHTPAASVIVRVVARIYCVEKPIIIYTAHGFHFYKGASIKNWLIYYPIELMLSNLTDILITMNQEDYDLAYSKFKHPIVRYIPGVGIDLEKIDQYYKRIDHGFNNNPITLVSVGELSVRKNHKVVIEAVSKLKSIDIEYFIVGTGEKFDELKKLSEDLNVNDKVKFLGYRDDVFDILSKADIFVFPSLQEGLPVALMEAMAMGLPVIASKIRGNVDLLKNSPFLVEPSDINGYVKCLIKLIDKDLRINIGNKNRKLIHNYSINNVEKEMKQIYLLREKIK